MITSALKKFFSVDPYQAMAHEAYVPLVAAARQPFFYEKAGVPDTLDGRFDVMALHMFLLTHRLQKEQPEFIRALWEVFFSDMDRSLREMGASDTGIGKRVKKIAQAFYGRMTAYEASFSSDADFKESLIRNLYRGAPVSDAQLSQIMDYAKASSAKLAAQPAGDLMNGIINF